MRTLLSIILLLALDCTAQYLQHGRKAFKNTAIPPSGSCPGNESPDQANDGASLIAIGDSATLRYYIGCRWTNSSDRAICKIGFELRKSAGSITAKTFNAKIFSMSGTSLDSELGNSDAVTGNDAWNATWVYFSFSSPVSLTANTPYALAITMSEADASNYTSTYYSTANNIADCSYARWKQDKTLGSSDGTLEPSIKIYFYD